MFSSKYPSINSLFLLISNFGKDMAVPGETIVQKLEGSFSLIPQVLQFVGQASSLGVQLKALEASPEDMVQAAESLVNDFGFTSDKAHKIIAASFPIGEAFVSIIPSFKALFEAFKA